ncbi:3624_t:CDS:2 [Acaulospora morrowiae]|uniref:3624_t:CDS:1 n=1 Tax=Acaulospora morrowiae TaxID=94023 RepID=A0A9N8YQG3_9GLOM|nr:3624_t:CDS:2 [Acaulospora morrowiae]
MSTRYSPLVRDRWTQRDTLLLVESLNLSQGNFKEAAELLRRPVHECHKKWSTDLRSSSEYYAYVLRRSKALMKNTPVPRPVPRPIPGFTNTVTIISSNLSISEEYVRIKQRMNISNILNPDDI